MACYLGSLLLFEKSDSLAFIAAVNILRFAPLFLAAPRQWPILLAAPYPFSLVFTAYAERSTWMPESVAMYVSSPTAFLIFVSALLLASLVLTSWILAKCTTGDIGVRLRYLQMILFAVTAAAVLVSIPQISVKILHYVAEPVALAGYASVFGWGLRPTLRVSR